MNRRSDSFPVCELSRMQLDGLQLGASFLDATETPTKTCNQRISSKLVEFFNLPAHLCDEVGGLRICGNNNAASKLQGGDYC